MARSRPKAKSLAALAASLDTKKRAPPVKLERSAGALRNDDVRALQAAVSGRVSQRPRAAGSRPTPPVQTPRASSLLAKRPVSAPARPVVQKASMVAKPAFVARTPVGSSAARPASQPVTRAPVSSSLARPAQPVVQRPVATTSRTAALGSLHRIPSAPGKLPGGLPESRRKYPRAELQVRAKLSLAGDPSHYFEATLPTLNISVGGLFLQSSFFLKAGTRLLIELQLPIGGTAKRPAIRAVKVMGEVVRVVTTAANDDSGFALRFTEYFDGSEVVLATHFLSPLLKDFIAGYAKQHQFDASAEYIAHTADVLAAWELRKAELGADVWELATRD